MYDVYTYYIVHGIMRAVIEFYTERDGTKPVLIFLNDLKVKSKTSYEVKQLYKMVLRGLLFLQQVGVQHALEHISTLEREDGVPYSIQLVKELKGYSPLLEFRINWRFVDGATPGAARILFVNLEHESVFYLVLIRAVVKSKTKDRVFEQQRDEAFRLLPSLFQNPGQYITLSGEEK
ncbi:hypothetical protein [Paenibacillus medicaginis]|uniref:Uncharacterized protein n=1 Tax=Paenibacillus medicaginis TaxID=1470560 RepID=A0ABV5C208_9BACL